MKSIENRLNCTGDQDAKSGYVELDILPSGIAWLRINNPRRYNAMTLAMWQSFHDHVQTANNDPEVRVIAVHGAGKRAFMSGADISEFDSQRDSKEQVDLYDQAVSAAQNALESSDKSSVAVIQGVCIGGGIGIALSCDLRICTETTKFRMPAARVGLGYDIEGLRRAVDILGYANTADIFFSARTFSGMEAQQLGLVNHCFNEQEFAEQTGKALDEIIDNAPLTLRAVKRALRHITNPESIKLKEVEAAIATCFSSQDYREGR